MPKPNEDDPLLPFFELSSSIDIDGLRIRAMPKPDIFVCGGPVKPPSSSAAVPTASAAASVRQVFMNKVKAEGVNDSKFFSRFVLAEDIAEDWYTREHYDNLLDLEEDLAHLANGIIIFLESPGSLTELGAFVQTKHLTDKIIAIIDPKHEKDKSFINLGPLNKLKKLCGKDSVIYYPHSDIASCYEDLKRDICSKCKQEERKFESDRFEDLCILILEIINFAGYAKKVEIKKFIENLKIEIDDKKMNRSLFILENIKCITRKAYGNTKYYTLLNTDSYISFSYKKKNKIY